MRHYIKVFEMYKQKHMDMFSLLTFYVYDIN